DGTPSTGGGCFATAGFDFVDGPLPGTTLEILGGTQVFYENGSDRVIDVDTLELYEPQDVRLTTRDGRIFELDLNDGVTLLEDLNGNRLSITPAGITHSSGQGIVFERDAEERITRIVDPLGNPVSYQYDEAGNLEKASNQEGHETRFAYDENHRIIDIVDPRGVQAVRNDYDADGQLIKMTDASGRVIELQHDLDNRQEVLINRLGLAKVLEYDSRGNVIVEIDEEGRATTRTYDSRDHLLTEKNALGHVTTITYDGDGNLTSVQDPLGNVTTFTYDSRGNPLTIVDPMGNVTTNTWSASGNLLTVRDPLGYESSFVYDGSGNLLSQTDATGATTTFVYDSRGNPTQTIDALGNETNSTYDAVGNLTSRTASRTLPDGSTETLTTTFTVDRLGRTTSTTFPDGSNWQTSYDGLGAVLSARDALGRVTHFSYDLAGRRTGSTYPDGSTDSRAYDAEGRLIASTDRAGRTTQRAYDNVGRLIATVLPDGNTETREYDTAGRLTATTDARGFRTRYQYDAAGRRTSVIDALGHETAFAYDQAGRRIAVTDARGGTTGLFHDAAGRRIRTEFPNATSTAVAYDEVGRGLAETDTAGLTTRFEYDPLGRLTKLTDALSQEKVFTYDEVGNRLTQTDANGHSITFGYDQMGRQTRRTLPDGATESFAYDSAGNRIERLDFMNRLTTYQYDSSNRLLRRSYPDGSFHAFTYTATGRRATMVDGRGSTSYEYDDRDRLKSKTDPSGWKLAYTWDEAGNRTSVTAMLVGGTQWTTNYAYDASHRLETVTDSAGRQYTMTFDEVGNRQTLTHPNDVVTTYQYDELSRLLELESVNGSGEVVQSYQYTLGPTGRRQRIDEHGGVIRVFEHDDVYQLSSETVSREGEELYATTFAYDPMGNCVQQIYDDGEPVLINYTYDERYRLLSEGDQTYAWDANGNLLSKDGEVDHTWDFENRLQSVILADGTVVEQVYDADGVWLESRFTEPGGPAVVRRFVVDTSGGLSQVIAEIDSSGSLATGYVRGRELLAQVSAGDESYAHAEAIGSIRALTTADGAVSDTWMYSAFGEVFERSGSTGSGIGYTGEQVGTDTGLMYLRARWMDPRVGAFLSEDPIKGSTTTQILDAYTYASNDPIDVRDPSGRIGVAGLMIGGAFVGGLASIGVNYALGEPINKVTIASGALFGMVLGPMVMIPELAVGLGALAMLASGSITYRVWSNPDSTGGQKAVAVGLVVASIAGFALGLRYYRSHRGGGSSASSAMPRPGEAIGLPDINFPLPTLRSPPGVRLYSGGARGRFQQELRPPSVEGIPGTMNSLKLGRPVNPIEIIELSSDRIAIIDGHHRMVAALVIYRDTGNASYVYQLLAQAIRKNAAWFGYNEFVVHQFLAGTL
ncbi:MAG: hypothetical protein GY722_28925, partial [bacterium]|nr:hypothetical protein [bacterium]